jgi:hypothetical protein
VPWNDEIFRRIVDEAAHRVGKSRTQVLLDAGIARGTLTQEPRHGRGLALIERLMPALEWGPEDALCAIAQSFGWGDRPMKDGADSPRKGLRMTLEAIAAAAKRLSATLPSDDSVASLEDALALVGELVRAREDRAEGNRQGD